MSDYEDKLQKILHGAWPDIDKHHAQDFRKLFGVIGGYVEDKIFCSCGPFGFALKLPENERDSIFEAGGKPLKIFKNGHVKKDYAVLSDSMIEERKELRRLIETSIKFTTQPKGD